jgi:hypothetical protein
MNLIDNPGFQSVEGWRNDHLQRHRGRHMENITVDKATLLAKLKANRDEHREMFLQAQDVYRDKMIAELDLALQEAREGKKIRRSFSLPVPEDHTEDFNTAIQMLEWEQGDQVQLGYGDFQQYVQNQWRWAASFAANTSAYLSE